MVCNGCSISEVELIHACHNSDKEALRILEAHGVIPVKRNCGRCGRELNLSSDGSGFRCHKRFRPNPKSWKEVRCAFYASRFRDTWLEQARLPPRIILLFINGFLRKSFTQEYFLRNYGLSPTTIVDWKSFCSEVCEAWLADQEPIGGPGKVVEVGENKFNKGENNCGRCVDDVWVFGGVERGTGRRFVVPVEQRDTETLIPLCQKYILPCTTIYSSSQSDYSSLSELGYQHQVVNQSKNSVDPVSDVHTNTIKGLWNDIKGWVLKAGNRKVHYRQYLARYLFCHSHPDHNTILHHFLREIAHHNPPPQ